MTDAANRPYQVLVRLLTYPDAGYAEFVQSAPETLPELEPFASAVRELSLTETQELFTRTFDLSPTCTLEVGWHLYGEEYARGAFMVSVREQLRRFSIQENGELPDHLTHILLVADAMESDERAALVSTFALPAVRKMVKALEGKDNPYGTVIRTAEAILLNTPGVEEPPEERQPDFRILSNQESVSDLLEEEIPYG